MVERQGTALGPGRREACFVELLAYDGNVPLILSVICAIDLAADYFDDPTLQLARYISRDLSPINHSGSTDRYLDALFVGQAISTDVRQRANIVREFERHALSEAFTVPLLWWNRIIVTAEKFKGWNVSPSHYIAQDLADVWLQD